MNHVTYSLCSATAFFSLEISKICYTKKYRYRLYFDTLVLILLTFIESLKIFLKNLALILIMRVKIAMPGFLKTKVFWKKVMAF